MAKTPWANGSDRSFTGGQAATVLAETHYAHADAKSHDRWYNAPHRPLLKFNLLNFWVLKKVKTVFPDPENRKLQRQ